VKCENELEALLLLIRTLTVGIYMCLSLLQRCIFVIVWFLSDEQWVRFF